MENFGGFPRQFQVSCVYGVEGTTEDCDFQSHYVNRLGAWVNQDVELNSQLFADLGH